MSDDRIKRLLQKRAALDKQIAEAEKARKEKAREDDTRMCFIAGRTIRKYTELNPESDLTKQFWRLMDESVSGKADRKLFDLPTRAKAPGNDEENPTLD